MSSRKCHLFQLSLLWWWVVVYFLCMITTTTTTTTTTTSSSSSSSQWRSYPQRCREEAAVIEWGHSAIISAIDASVAYFGPQTSQAALFEVETTPLLADPIHGIFSSLSVDPEEEEDRTNHSEDKDVAATTRQTPSQLVLNNAAQLHGNVAVMTDAAVTADDNDHQDPLYNNSITTTTCLDLAILAHNSQAAALILVHVNEARPDDAPRCTIPLGREAEAARIDIPIVTISLASVDVLTSATVTEDTKPEDVINHGMPERYVVMEKKIFVTCFWMMESNPILLVVLLSTSSPPPPPLQYTLVCWW
jgi:hypothetical protein